MKNKNVTGFTLIELLVVISIIAILITVLVPNLLGVRIRARDTRRKADVAEIQKALELYKLDQNPQRYPDTSFMDSALCNACWSQGANCTGNIYMRKVPCDPAVADQTYIYTLDAGDNLLYTLTACLENTQDKDKDATTVTACSDMGRVSYTLYEP